MWRTVKQKILANNALVKRYGLLVTTDLCGKALGLVVAKIAVQRFGADGFGIIGVTLTWVSYALLVGNFGLDSYAVKTAAKRQESIGTLGGTLITMELLFGVAIYAILILVALCVPSLRPHLALISIFGLSLITVALTLNWVPLALERSNITGYVGLAVQATNLLLLVLLLQRSNHLWTFAAAKVSAEVMGAAVLLIWTIQVVGPIKRPLPVAQWWGILRHSAPIGGAMIFRTVSLTCDLALLGIFTAESWRHLRWPAHVDLAQIGQYNGAIKVFGLYLTLGSLYFMVLFPRLAKISNQGMVPLKKAADESLAVVTLGAVGGAGILAIAAPLVLKILYVPSFAAAANPLRILLCAGIANQMSKHFRQTLFLVGRQKVDLKLSAVAAGAHVVLKLALIPFLGVIGCALGMLLGEALLAGLAWRAVRKAFTEVAGSEELETTCLTAAEP